MSCYRGVMKPQLHLSSQKKFVLIVMTMDRALYHYDVAVSVIILGINVHTKSMDVLNVERVQVKDALL